MAGAAEGARRPVTLVFTDVEGSTSLWERYGSAFRAALDVHDAALRASLALFGGYEVRTEGDAFVVAFGDPADAVRFCLDAQLRLQAAPWPPDLPDEGGIRGLRVRMGAHGGPLDEGVDPLTGRRTFTGAGAHRAARVSAAGHGGQIVIDDTVIGAARALPEALVEPLGEYALQGPRDATMLAQVLPHALIGRRFPALRAVRRSRSNLPEPEGPILGREEDAERVRAALEGASCVTLTGPGGTGKTRLSLEVARSTEPGEGGVWFADASTATTGEGLVVALARALDADSPGNLDARVIQLLRRGPTLLVLDNVEQIPDAAVPVARWLAIPGVRVLATSRAPLGIEGEVVVPLDPLAIPAGAGAENAAVALFEARARAVVPAFRVTAANLDAVLALARRLDGLPLAIELAAARVAILSPQKLLERLDRPFDLLRAPRSDRPSRQTSLLAAIEGSWDLLSEPERAAFAQLSVFRGPFEDDGVRSVVDLSAWPEAEPVATVARLVACSLVRRESDGSYRLLESLRQYAAGRLGAERGAAEVRHGQHFGARGQDEVLDALQRAAVPERRRWRRLHLENLVAAVERAMARGDAAVGAGAAIAASHVYNTVGPVGIGMELIARALALSHTGPDRARLLERRGALEMAGGDAIGAERSLDEAIVASAGHAGPLAVTTFRRGQARRMRGDADGARSDAHAALALAKQSGWDGLVPAIHNVLAQSDLQEGRWEQALEGFATTRRLAFAQHDRQTALAAGANLAVVYQQTGRPGDAVRLYREMLDEMRALGVLVHEGVMLANLANGLLHTGDLEAARAAVIDARSSHAVAGNARGEALTCVTAAQVELAAGDPAAAEALAEAGAVRLAAQGNAIFEAVAHYVRGEALTELGRYDEARAEAERALQITTEASPDPHVAALSRTLVAWIRVVSGETLEGADVAAEAARVLTEIGARSDLVGLLGRESRLARRAGQIARAERTLAEAEALAVELGVAPRSPSGVDLAAARAEA